MTPESNTRPWYRFFDGNKKYDYKSLYNAVSWAERKVPTSTSREIRVYKLEKRGRALELDMIVRVIHNRPAKARIVDGIEPGERVQLEATRGSTTVVWRDSDVYAEYKEKEQWVSSSSGEE